MRHRRVLCLGGDDAAHGEAIGSCVGVSRQSLERLSEKGFEQRSERGFCQYMEGEIGQTCLLSGP
jgi:hypothetical protein